MKNYFPLQFLNTYIFNNSVFSILHGRNINIYYKTSSLLFQLHDKNGNFCIFELTLPFAVRNP